MSRDVYPPLTYIFWNSSDFHPPAWMFRNFFWPKLNSKIGLNLNLQYACTILTDQLFSVCQWMETLRCRGGRLHDHLPLLSGDSTLNRIRNQGDHQGVCQHHVPHVNPEHLWNSGKFRIIFWLSFLYYIELQFSFLSSWKTFSKCNNFYFSLSFRCHW